MKNILTFAVALAVSLGSYGCAQTAAAATSPTAPPVAASALSITEKVALGATFKQYQDAQAAMQGAVQQLRAIEADVQAAHPGWRYDENSGALVKLPEPAKNPVKTGAKPEEKPAEKAPPK